MKKSLPYPKGQEIVIFLRVGRHLQASLLQNCPYDDTYVCTVNRKLKRNLFKHLSPLRRCNVDDAAGAHGVVHVVPAGA